MRLKADIWVKAYLRRCAVAGAAGFVVKRGDSDGGTVLIRINMLDGRSHLLSPAPTGFSDDGGMRRFVARTSLDGDDDAVVEAMIKKSLAVDPDVWVVEIEDRDGRSFLEEGVET